ncbi:hypothetical protein PoB_000796900 [Plakobranchus ocellatus]|uniref:Uncharacterized protein n=1 Tax=Plakobranchus ocellatus TaxID=259542 RepID=A0AAV3YER2_9GAST|nr:hypothetical protein PoB_000796900 [Plakobranchus ocellatus]
MESHRKAITLRLEISDRLKNQTSSSQVDLRHSGPPSGQGAGGAARTRDRRVPADIRTDSPATVPPPEKGSPSREIAGSNACTQLLGSKDERRKSMRKLSPLDMMQHFISSDGALLHHPVDLRYISHRGTGHWRSSKVKLVNAQGRYAFVHITLWSFTKAFKASPNQGASGLSSNSQQEKLRENLWVPPTSQHERLSDFTVNGSKLT